MKRRKHNTKTAAHSRSKRAAPKANNAQPAG